MPATIINGPTALKNILALNSAKKIGFTMAGVVSDPTVHTTARRTCLGNIYNMIKMKSVEDITIACPVELPISFGGQYKTFQDMSDNVSENLNDFLCDYVYLDSEQFTISGGLISYETLISRVNKILIPFGESVATSDLRRYILSNMPVPFKTQTPNFPTITRKLVPQFTYFKWISDYSINHIRNETLYTLSGLNLATITFEYVAAVLSRYPYYKILNLDGDPATIDDLKAGKAIGYLYYSNEEKMDEQNRRASRVCWFGFGVGDLFDYTTKTFERSVIDVGIDNTLHTIWGTSEIYINTDSLAKTWDAFREDMKTYYGNKYM